MLHKVCRCDVAYIHRMQNNKYASKLKAPKYISRPLDVYLDVFEHVSGMLSLPNKQCHKTLWQIKFVK